MQRYLFFIDRISTWVGKAFAWCILILTFVVTYDVIMRKFGNPTVWAFDVSWMLYGTLFLMAGAYTLSRNGHVRGDVLYGFFPPRAQASLDLVLYFLFFVPGILALAYAGIGYAETSWGQKETSYNSPDIIIYPVKVLIPIAGMLVFLQGIAEIVRCIQCLRTGAWPGRAHDVEEIDIEELKQMVGVKDNDIAGTKP
ncbi:MAG: TRAP transporter small permease subunit [Pseudomonadota bacterium]|nr:TRAP transporter small permease subunit [Pseudomonadota bacterium]